MGHGARDGSRIEGRPDRLDAVLPAVQGELARGRSRDRGGRGNRCEGGRHPRRRTPEVEGPRARGRRSGRSRELAAHLADLARQRDHGKRQGPGVLPAALLGTHDNSVAEEDAKDKVKRE